MLLALLSHDDAAAVFDDLSFDFATMPGHETGEVRLSADNGPSHFWNAAGAERIRRPWKTQRRSAAFVALVQFARSPFRSGQLTLRNPPIDGLEAVPNSVRGTPYLVCITIVRTTLPVWQDRRDLR